MATFEEHIEGLTQVGITASSVPSQSELTGFLVDGLIDCVNKITILKPEELVKFTKTTNATDSVAKKGRILSVLREHDSESILRICPTTLKNVGGDLIREYLEPFAKATYKLV